MDEFRSEFEIARPLAQVWDVFLDIRHWKQWHGGEITRVDPGWEDDALVHWKLGEPSRVVSILEHQWVKLQSDAGGSLGHVTEWRFTSTDNGTRVEVSEDYSDSGLKVTDPATHLLDLNITHIHLKALLESESAAADNRRQETLAGLKSVLGRVEANIDDAEERLLGMRIATDPALSKLLRRGHPRYIPVGNGQERMIQPYLFTVDPEHPVEVPRETYYGIAKLSPEARATLLAQQQTPAGHDVRKSKGPWWKFWKS